MGRSSGRDFRESWADAKRRLQTPRPAYCVPRLKSAERSGLLLGTALGSTLLLGSLFAAPAHAVEVCPPNIVDNAATPLTCNNNAPVANPAGDAFHLDTTGDNNTIAVNNGPNGTLNASEDGIDTHTDGIDADIVIDNKGGITAGTGFGIYAGTTGGYSAFDGGTVGDITITNTAPITTSASGAPTAAIGAYSHGTNGKYGGDAGDITIVNSGALSTTGTYTAGIGAIDIGGNGSGGGILFGGPGYGGDSGDIVIHNSAPLITTSGNSSPGIYAATFGGDGYGGLGLLSGYSGIGYGGDAGDIGRPGEPVTNSSTIITTGNYADGIHAVSNGGSGYGGFGANGYGGGGGGIRIANSGVIVTSGTYSNGIFASAAGGAGRGGFVDGKYAGAGGGDGYGGDSGDIVITNSSSITTTGNGAAGIRASSYGGVGVGGDSTGVYGGEDGPAGNGYGGDSGSITIVNNGAIRTSGMEAHGIYASVEGGSGYGGDYDPQDGYGGGGEATVSPAQVGESEAGAGYGGDSGIVRIINASTIVTTGANSDGIRAIARPGLGYGGFDSESGVSGEGVNGVSGIIVISNSGAINAARDGISAINFGNDITINSSGEVRGGRYGAYTSEYAGGFMHPDLAPALAGGHTTTFNVSSLMYGVVAGISAYSATDTVVNVLPGGVVTAQSLLAIDTSGGPTAINNQGIVLGFVDLTDNGDTFTNQSGGRFEARTGVGDKDTDFRGGDDLFDNQSGAVVHTAANIAAQENVRFVNLETFQSAGAVSLQDGKEGDRFTLANTLDGTDLDFVARPGSSLAVDAFLGGAGSISDVLRIDGDVNGEMEHPSLQAQSVSATGSQTKVDVQNTNFGPGTFNKEGITVVEVRGAVDENAFALRNGPIDTGFFNYDLFFEPKTAHADPFNEFELRSFLGAGAFILPQLITAAQDIAFNTSSSWFDRTADLRTIINGGTFGVTTTQPAMLAGGGMKDDGYSERPGLSAAWARGSIGTLDRDGDASTSAFGKTFDFNLDRDLLVADFVTGRDFGIRDVMRPGDAFIFGVLSGWVHADLDFDQVDRQFDYDGYELGVYGTYISGGLFVDGLVQAQFLDLETDSLGFRRNDLDVDTYTGRLEAGYRYGFSGLFFEPLATIAVAWADVEDFSFAGNSVDFDHDAAVRGRLGLRVGTNYTLWDTIRVEPFVIGSVWGRFTDDNNATLVSTNTAFALSDDNDDVWGEVSIGSNYFNMSKRVSAFSKTDIQFGDDLSGVTSRFGLKYIW